MQRLGASRVVANQANILLNPQVTIRNENSANRFLFIAFGIFLLFSLKK
jgi:hypothetical protein